MVWTYLLISHPLRDWDVKFNQVLNGGPCMDMGTQKMDSVRQCAPSKPGSSHSPDGPEYQTPPAPMAPHQDRYVMLSCVPALCKRAALRVGGHPPHSCEEAQRPTQAPSLVTSRQSPV